MKIKDLLPIGSIILLEEAKKKLMIIGVKQTNPEDMVEYDYMGVVYPEGNMGENTQFLFNHEDITQVVFRGYEDWEREEFINHLANFYQEA